MPVPAALALAATLYHCLNHSLMKSLLFLGTGSVLHATGERNLGRLGGLIHRMPWVAWMSLVGALAIAGLPPLNGFVSEWLLLQSFLFADRIPHEFVNLLIPMSTAVVALAAALAGYVMVKFFGVIFLGRPRESSLANAHDCGVLERFGLVWLGLGCVALGLAPVQVLGALSHVTQQLTGISLSQQGGPWWLLAPVPTRQVSYGPLVFFLAIALVVALTFLAVRLFYHQRVRRAPAWDCGFGGLTARMQDTAEGFGQPIRNIFQSFFSIERELPTPFDRAPRYRIAITDRIWRGLYQPLGRLVQWLADTVAVLQQGRISVYLLYSFGTLIVLLALALIS
jgi:NADH:ubiquinone oxidoreductase subunit 5 (subunit L)/multisubunit Na+/H+ antiporter MnhA subunit